MGVASTSTDKSLRIFNGRTKYSEWLFIPGQPRIVGLQGGPSIIGPGNRPFDEDKLGSLEVGKLADLVVLSDDPLSVSDNRLKRLRSVLTMQAGRIVHGEER